MKVTKKLFSVRVVLYPQIVILIQFYENFYTKYTQIGSIYYLLPLKAIFKFLPTENRSIITESFLIKKIMKMSIIKLY